MEEVDKITMNSEIDVEAVGLWFFYGKLRLGRRRSMAVENNIGRKERQRLIGRGRQWTDEYLYPTTKVGSIKVMDVERNNGKKTLGRRKEM